MSVVAQACPQDKEQLVERDSFSEVLWFQVIQVVADELRPPDAFLDAIERDSGGGRVGGLVAAAENSPAGAVRAGGSKIEITRRENWLFFFPLSPDGTVNSTDALLGVTLIAVFTIDQDHSSISHHLGCALPFVARASLTLT